MNILILLVIAMFIITAGYVGYYASQNQPVEEIKGHGAEFEILGTETDLTQMTQNSTLGKSII